MFRHVLKFRKFTGGTTIKNDDGHFIDVPGTEEIVEIPCLYNVNAGSRSIASEDGSAVIFSFTVSMPLGHQDIPRGTQVQVFEDDLLLQSGTVKVFQRGLMDAKAWV